MIDREFSNLPHPASEDEDKPAFEEVDSFELRRDEKLPDEKFVFGNYTPDIIPQAKDESVEEYISRFAKTVVTHAQRDLHLFPNEDFIVSGIKKTYVEILFDVKFKQEVNSLLDYLISLDKGKSNAIQSLRSVRVAKSMILGDVGYSPGYPDMVDINHNFFESKIPGGGVVSKDRKFLYEAFHCNPLVDNRSYASTLFLIPDPSNENAHEYLRHKVDGKKLLILGGGDSLMDILTEDTLNPRAVVNIDPFLLSEDRSKNTKSIYHSVTMEAEDPGLSDEVKKIVPDAFDEVWSLYSVPFYTKTAEGMHNLVNNIATQLAPGGSWRIYPYGFPVFGDETEHETDLRIKAFQDEVISLLDSGKFNVQVVKLREELGYRTMIITKKPKAEFEESLESL